MIAYHSPSLWLINNCLLTTLSVTDFLSGLITMSCAIIALYHSEDINLCPTQGFLVTFFNGISLAITAAVSID